MIIYGVTNTVGNELFCEVHTNLAVVLNIQQEKEYVNGIPTCTYSFDVDDDDPLIAAINEAGVISSPANY
jgi:hypothetical protein